MKNDGKSSLVLTVLVLVFLSAGKRIRFEPVGQNCSIATDSTG